MISLFAFLSLNFCKEETGIFWKGLFGALLTDITGLFKTGFSFFFISTGAFGGWGFFISAFGVWGFLLFSPPLHFVLGFFNLYPLWH